MTASRIISPLRNRSSVLFPHPMVVWRTDHHVVGIGIFSDADNGVTAFQAVGDDKRASFGHLMMSSKISTHQEVDMLYSLVLMKHRQGILRIVDVFAKARKGLFFLSFSYVIFVHFSPFRG